MDAQSTDLERGIEQQRKRIGQKLVNLRERLRSDRQEVQTSAKRQASRAGQMTLRSLAVIGGVIGAGAILRMGYSAWRRGQSPQRKRRRAAEDESIFR